MPCWRLSSATSRRGYERQQARCASGVVELALTPPEKTVITDRVRSGLTQDAP
jgi:hypothetical protein